MNHSLSLDRKRFIFLPLLSTWPSCFISWKHSTFLCKPHEDTLPCKHPVVKIKRAHRLYLSDRTEKWLASSRRKVEGNPLPCDWSLSLSLFRKPEFLSAIRLSWLALFSYSVFSSLFCSVFWDGLPPSSSFVFVSLFEPQAVEWVHWKSQCLRSSQGDEWTLGASLAELGSAFWEEWLLGCQTEAWHRYVWELLDVNLLVFSLTIHFLSGHAVTIAMFLWFLYFKSLIDVYFGVQTPVKRSNTLFFVQPCYFTPRCNVAANVFCFTLRGWELFCHFLYILWFNPLLIEQLLQLCSPGFYS